MRDLCIKNNIHQLAMPLIGCGLDKLEWSKVKELIQHIFDRVDIEITIYIKDTHRTTKISSKRGRNVTTKDHRDRSQSRSDQNRAKIEIGSEPCSKKPRRDQH